VLVASKIQLIPILIQLALYFINNDAPQGVLYHAQNKKNF